MQFIDLRAQYERIREAVQARIEAVLDHGQFILGPEVEELERTLADFVGVRACVGLSSGTDALLAALMALEIGRGDEVITSAFSFAATAETIALLGARPVMVDIDPATYTLDPARIEQAITGRTRAILPVSLYGQCADMAAIAALARAHGLPVIEDAAQSFGATFQGRRSCGLSRVGCTSFFPSKPLGAYGDAGACFTDDGELAARLREIRNHGQDRRYHHPRLGLNGRLDTLQAAILLAKFSVFPQEVEARARLGARYTQLLIERGAVLGDAGGKGALVVPAVPADRTSVFAQYTVQVEQRAAVAERLQAAGIPTAIHYPIPLNEQPAFDIGEFALATPVSRAVSQRVLSLPMHPDLTEADQVRVADALLAAVREVTKH